MDETQSVMIIQEYNLVEKLLFDLVSLLNS